MVVVTDGNAAAAADVVKRLEESGEKVVAIAADISKKDECLTLIEKPKL